MASKYRAQRTEYNGRTYSSKLEATVAQRLDIQRRADAAIDRVIAVVEQPVFPLPAGIIYRADFWVVFADGHDEVWEAKGFETKEWRLKKRLFKELYPWLCLLVVKA